MGTTGAEDLAERLADLRVQLRAAARADTQERPFDPTERPHPYDRATLEAPLVMQVFQAMDEAARMVITFQVRDRALEQRVADLSSANAALTVQADRARGDSGTRVSAAEDWAHEVAQAAGLEADVPAEIDRRVGENHELWYRMDVERARLDQFRVAVVCIAHELAKAKDAGLGLTPEMLATVLREIAKENRKARK